MLIMVFNMVCMASDTFFYSINDIPEGKLVAEYPSNYGTESVNVYLIENPLGDAIRCEAELADGSVRNFYWEVGANSAMVTWLNKDQVYIKVGEKVGTYDVYKSTYDSRDVNEELEHHLDEQQIERNTYQ